MIRTIQQGTGVSAQGDWVCPICGLPDPPTNPFCFCKPEKSAVRVGTQTYTGALIPQNTGE